MKFSCTDITWYTLNHVRNEYWQIMVTLFVTISLPLPDYLCYALWEWITISMRIALNSFEIHIQHAREFKKTWIIATISFPPLSDVMQQLPYRHVSTILCACCFRWNWKYTLALICSMCCSISFRFSIQIFTAYTLQNNTLTKEIFSVWWLQNIVIFHP